MKTIIDIAIGIACGLLMSGPALIVTLWKAGAL